MNQTEFTEQIKRLESQWPHTYGSERKAMLFFAFRNEPAEIFRDAVSDSLLIYRAAPLLEELSKAIEKSKVRHAQERQTNYFSGMYDTLKKLSERSTKADPDFVRTCLSLLDKKLSRRLTQAEWEDGCRSLDSLAKTISHSRGETQPRDSVRDRQSKSD